MAEDIVAVLNAFPGWTKEMGIVILTATPDEVTCAFEVGEKHHQGFGIVHGGVHAGVVETLASIGAALVAKPRGQRVVGVENNTSFIRAVRSGRLHANARPCGCCASTRSGRWAERLRAELRRATRVAADNLPFRRSLRLLFRHELNGL